MKRFFGAAWRMLKKNWLLKIMAIFFAVLLWSYVLGVTNPIRERTIEDISVRFTNVEDLQAKGLAISGSLSELLDTVDARIEIEQTNIKYLNNENVYAYIDLSTINRTGMHTIRITSSSSYGQVLDITPREVTVFVDNLVEKPIPVTAQITGSVAAGYYAADPVIIPDVVLIEGAQVDVEKVVSAVCYIDLTGHTENFRESVDIVLLNENGSAINQNMFKGSVPSVIVEQSIQATKTVPIDISDVLLGADELVAGYELSDISVEPQSVQILGEKSVLDTITSIGLMPFSVSGADKDIITLLDIKLPEGVTLMNEGQVQVYISIIEIVDVKTFEGITVQAKNLDNKLKASFNPTKVDVTVISGVNRLALLFKEDIVPYVDLDGLGVGTHTLNILFDLPEGFLPENVSSATIQITVKITK